MNDKERDEILYRLDERTEIMSKDMTEFSRELREQRAKISEQRTRISETQDVAQDNRMLLSGLTFGVGTFVTAVIGKISGWLQF